MQICPFHTTLAFASSKGLRLRIMLRATLDSTVEPDGELCTSALPLHMSFALG